MSVLFETGGNTERQFKDKDVTKIGKAFSDIQRIGECFVEAGLQALICQL